MMQFFVEFGHQLGCPIFLQPAIATVSNNLQQPGPRVASAKMIKESVSAKHGLLNDVLSVRWIS